MASQDQRHPDQSKGGIPGVPRDNDGFTMYLRDARSVDDVAADVQEQWSSLPPNPTTVRYPSEGILVQSRAPVSTSSLRATVGSTSNAPSTPLDVPPYANGCHNAIDGRDEDRSHIGAWCADKERNEKEHGSTANGE